MSLTVTQRPINGTVKHSAVFNPIIYKMQRKDYTITAFASSGGALQITVSTNLTTTTPAKGLPVTAGSTIWVTSDNGVYNGLFTVTTITSTTITFGAGTYTSAATTGYLNLISNRTSYSVQVGVYAGLLSAETLQYTLNVTPSQSGLVAIDVSNLKNFTSGTPGKYIYQQSDTQNSAADGTLRIAKNYQSTTSGLQYYIKYTEVWTSSAETETDDSANKYFAVHRVNQIGDQNGSFFPAYGSTAEWLTGSSITDPQFGTIKKSRYFRGFPFVASILYDGTTIASTANVMIKKELADINGNIVMAVYEPVAWQGIANAFPIECYMDETQKVLAMTGAPVGLATTYTNNKLHTWRNILPWNNYLKTAGNVAWTIPAISADGLIGQPTVTIAAAATGATAQSQILWMPIEKGSASSIEICIDGVDSGAAGANAITIEIFSNGTTTASTTQSFAGGSTLSAQYFTVTNTSTNPFVGIRFTSNATTASRTFTLQNFYVRIPFENSNFQRLEFSLSSIAGGITSTSWPAFSESLIAFVSDPCAEAIQLLWKNQKGGDSTFVFSDFSEISYRYPNKKSKQYLLKASGLTLSEWESLNELNTTGVIYEKPITELTQWTNETINRQGVRVWMVDPNYKSGRVGVIVIPREQATNIKWANHSIEIQIELPEILNFG